jgi:uncharacterized protein (DUF169 family)
MDVTGRPGCAALPRALASGQPGLSLGCAGMRTFTSIGDDMNLAAIPVSALDGFLDDLSGMVEANAAMRSFYVQQKAAIA